MKEFLEKLVVEKSEQKERKAIDIMPLLSFTDEMLADDTKYELSYSDMLEMFSKVNVKIVEETEEVNEADQNPVVEEYPPITY